MPAASREKKIILVDPDDNPIGEIGKLAGHQYGMLHRAFSVFLFRRRHGQVETLLQQREQNKYHGGGLWSNACCSHPYAGDSLVQAAEKRLIEEMGVKASLKAAGKFHYIAQFDNGMTENEIDHVFVGDCELDTLSVNPEEVQAYQWIAVDALKVQIENEPHQFTPWLAKALSLACEGWNKR